MLRVLLIGTLIAGTVPFIAGADSAASEAIVASAGSLNLTYSEAVTELERLQSEKPRVDAPSVREIRSALAGLLRDETMAQEAVAQGLDKRPDVAANLESARRGVLKEALRQEKLGTLDDDTLEALAKDYYDTRRESFRVRPEIEVSHILFAVKKCGGADAAACKEERAAQQAKANEVLAKLLKGGDFAQTAEELSEDPNSAKLGGKIPFPLTARKIDPRFWEAAWKLKPGELSGVVETQFGYHIIRLDAKTQEGIPSYAEVKRNLKKALNEEQQRARAAAIESEYYQMAWDGQWDDKALQALAKQFTPADEEK